MPTTKATSKDATPTGLTGAAAKAAEVRLADVKKLNEAGGGRKPAGTRAPQARAATSVAKVPEISIARRATSVAVQAKPLPKAPPAQTSLVAPSARGTAAPLARATLEKKIMTDMTKATEGLFKAAEEAAEFGRGNAEALTRATQLYFAGVQDLGKQTMALFQGLSEHAMESAKALSGVKSLKEAADLQASYTRATMEKTFSESAKLQETALKLAESSFAPLSARMTLAVEKFSKPLAA